MRLKKIVQLACAALAIGASVAAQAATVNFEDQSYNFHNTNFVSDGYKFVTNAPYSYAITTNQQVCSPGCPLSGSMELLLPFGPATVTMTAASGSTFSLNSFLAAGSFNQGSAYDPTTVTITGLLASGGTVTESFGIAASSSNSTLPFTLETANASFADLTSVTFTSSGSSHSVYNGFTLDDIVVNKPSTSAVPESSSMVLMFAGLGMFGIAARRRQIRG